MRFESITSRRAAYAAALTLAFLMPAAAMNVQPIVLDMVSAGPQARNVVQVINDGASPLPLEVVIKKLDISIDGKNIETPAKDDFLVFPPQALVPAGATQTFRVQWVGEPDIKKTASYIIYFNQIPVQRKGGASGVQVVFNFGVITNVAPVGAKPQLNFVSAEASTREGKRGALVTVENPSAMHAYFTDSEVSVQSEGWSKTFKTGELRLVLGYGVVLPGKKRRFFIPAADLPAGASKLTGSLKYTPSKDK